MAEVLGFEAFFQREYPGLVRALYLLTADLPEAEDLAQETMARVYEKWDRVGRMDSPGGYVYRVAVNLNRQRLRHLAVRARRLLATAVGPDDAPTPDTQKLAGAIGVNAFDLRAGRRPGRISSLSEDRFLISSWMTKLVHNPPDHPHQQERVDQVEQAPFHLGGIGEAHGSSAP